MKITCVNCQAAIPPDQINVSTDVAFCPQCSEAFSISSLVASGNADDGADLGEPPRGLWFKDRVTGWTISATTRSAAAFFLVPFMCVWSGFSLGGIYGTQLIKGEFDLLPSLFGIPFVLGTLLFGSIAAMTVAGRQAIRVDGNMGGVFTGVGPIGWTRVFDWQTVTRIDEEPFRQSENPNAKLIVLVGKTKIKLGSMLSDERRHYMLRLLRRLLTSRDGAAH
jgi:hypothetical protein